MFPRPTQHRTPLARRILAAVLAVGYLVAGVGLPVPAPAAVKVDPTGRSFPCQAKRCGCMTAEQCLGGKCCCSKPAAFEARPALAKSCCSAEPSDRAGDWVPVGWDAAKCRGHGPADLLTPPPALPAPEPVAVDTPHPRVNLPVGPTSKLAVRSDIPPTPPPRNHVPAPV